MIENYQKKQEGEDKMMVSLFAGVTGLKNHQTKMDVIGNNIANVNTVGFKKSVVNFEDLMSQNLANASGSQDNGLGGQNALQVGLGSSIGSIDTIWTNGAPQITGNDSDICIDGDGMFMLSDGATGSDRFYTRAGNFGLDGKGYLTASNGMKVQGWQAIKLADGTTEISEGAPITDLNVKLGEILPAKASTKASYSGNLNSNAGLKNLSITVDADGNGTGTTTTTIGIQFAYDPENEKWNWKASGTDSTGITGSGYFRVDASGKIKESVIETNIQNGTGTVLVDVPASGTLTFKEKSKPGNTATSTFVTNQAVTSNEVFDSMGAQHTLSIAFVKTGENVWQWQGEENDGLPIKNAKGFVTFDANGQIAGNYTEAKTLSTDPTRFTTFQNEDGVATASYPGVLQLGVAWDTSNKLNYYIPEGLRNSAGNFVSALGTELPEPIVPASIVYGDATSPYELDNNGVIKYRGVNNTITPAVDIEGNPIQAITLTSIPDKGAIMNNLYTGNMSFDPPSSTGTSVEAGGAIPAEQGGSVVKIMPDFSNISQFASSYSIKFSDQDGYSMGELEGFKINADGDIQGEYSNGYQQILGRVALAKFFNPAGLEKAGGNVYRQTANSGEPQVAAAATGGLGSLTPGSLEMSNVDLASEFTDMIIAQRGFQANSKTITTADQLLQDLINLKR